MDKFKDFYYNKKGKYILFFGFYLIFFIIFGIYMHSLNNREVKEEKEETKIEEKITTYDISNLVNNEYNYIINIIDNDEIINFKGSKFNIDYANYDNKYFLDIYNINQLLKRSKLVKNENNIFTYELSNSEINDILLTETKDGINIIEVSVNYKGEVNKISIDLKEYLEKDKYQINISYMVGDKNEDSSS